MTPDPPDPDDAPILPDLLRCDSTALPLGKRVLHIGGALLFFALGVIGWLIPIVPGIPFYILGLVLLAKAVPAVGQRVNAWERGLSPRWRLALRPGWRRRQAAGERGEAARRAREAGSDVEPE
ncbi:MAG: hypothetical protein DRQ55_06700 [Planctomycetota bacterium]|nr:MAG: hypothetical protein DRQ55_06700 [Planctomycetota bacterium]